MMTSALFFALPPDYKESLQIKSQEEIKGNETLSKRATEIGHRKSTGLKVKREGYSAISKVAKYSFTLP